MTIGYNRVRVEFNPSDNSLVGEIKQKTAELIDLCERHKHDARPNPSKLVKSEAIRLWALAQTRYEEAAMWAVKAATSPEH